MHQLSCFCLTLSLLKRLISNFWPVEKFSPSLKVESPLHGSPQKRCSGIMQSIWNEIHLMRSYFGKTMHHSYGEAPSMVKMKRWRYFFSVINCGILKCEHCRFQQNEHHCVQHPIHHDTSHIPSLYRCRTSSGRKSLYVNYSSARLHYWQCRPDEE